MSMNEARRNEIAYKLLKFWIGRKGLHLTPNIVNDLQEVCEKTGIPFEELTVFFRELISDFIEEIFNK